MTVRRTIDGMEAADWALVDRACALTGATPRALILVAANAAIQDATRSIVQREVAQQEDQRPGRQFDLFRPRPAAKRKTG